MRQGPQSLAMSDNGVGITFHNLRRCGDRDIPIERRPIRRSTTRWRRRATFSNFGIRAKLPRDICCFGDNGIADVSWEITP